ncbi:MAG: helix-turn-helix domain-containing protein [Clostridia bacterium]|nr:helix-turn-helix domain-containing protein [Clostridia bacterium]
MIKVLHKALNVLEFVSRHKEGQSLSAIAAAIGEKPTTTSNIVQVLARRSYLERVEGKWKLGIKAYMLTGSSADYDRSVCLCAEPLLRDLADETQASAVLSVWRGQERYVLFRVADGSPVTVNGEYPESKSIYGTATGILLLAAQEEAVIVGHISEHGVPGNPTPTAEQIATFRARLDLCRQQGYYYREKEGIFEAAAPVRDASGGVRTAVGIFLPLFRVSDRASLIASLLRTTEALEKTLHGRELL